jgi:1-acyl-sn-glycerol-3-phosphate acyltransferase
MSFSQRLMVTLFNALNTCVFRVDDNQVERVPLQGPLILVTNHINILEIPVIYARLQPRLLHGLVLAERWKNPVVAWGLNACGTIPLERGGANLDAMRRAVEVLKKGEMLIISPEGTRSGDGQMQKAYPGLVPLALKSKAPLLPVGYHGGEGYKKNLARLRRTDFHLEIGTPFTLVGRGEEISREVRQQMVDEVMYRIAEILPPQYRGVYADLSQATEKYIQRVQ